MGIDALGFSLSLLTIGLTMVAVRKGNMLFSIATAAVWAAFLNFILANTTAGTTWQEMFVISALVMIVVIPLLSFLSRQRASKLEAKGYYTSENGAITPTREKPRGYSEDSPEAYRQKVRQALHSRRRK